MSFTRGVTYPTVLLFLLGLVLWSAVGFVGFVLWPTAAREGTTVAPVPAPRHVEWSSYPVGGFVLQNPNLPDSLGRLPTVVLPPGSVLSVPRVVGGEDPEARRFQASAPQTYGTPFK